MNFKFKKALASLAALTMTASAFAPLAVIAEDGTAYTPLVEGDTVLKEWKFDFGSDENVADGYTAVTADTKYSSSLGYGMLGLENGFT